MTKQKPQLLFVHGFRGNHLGLLDTMKYFEAKGYECFAPDIPPAFNTKREKIPQLEGYSADAYAKWIADYILEKKLNHPILIGHSMGSIICAATAEKYPELINEKIVFLSPICVTPPKFICNLAPLTAIVPNKLIGYITTKYLLVPKDKETLREVLDITYKCAEKFTSKGDTAKAAKFSISYAISDFKFDKKAVFIAGESDKLNSQKQIKEVAKQFNSKPTFLKKSGHLINYECPIVLAKTIEENL
ncbi:alpha/beta fold hydrolase [Candidatus Saccharibacteria bacterium]|nr:alpha/beta fold hydrolase [Candidatus Saccharibacteria bacterium]